MHYISYTIFQWLWILSSWRQWWL